MPGRSKGVTPQEDSAVLEGEVVNLISPTAQMENADAGVSGSDNNGVVTTQGRSTQPTLETGSLSIVQSTPVEDHRGIKQQLFEQTLQRAQVDFLLQRTPRSEIRMRQGRGGGQFAYVTQSYVTERLNMVFGFNWDFQVSEYQVLDHEILVKGRLTVRTPSGQEIVKEQFGGVEIKKQKGSNQAQSIADDLKGAASDALKKCASLLGIGLDLYGREGDPFAEDSEPRTAGGQRQNSNSGGETSNSHTNLLASEQTAMIEALQSKGKTKDEAIAYIRNAMPEGVRYTQLNDQQRSAIRSNVYGYVRTQK